MKTTKKYYTSLFKSLLLILVLIVSVGSLSSCTSDNDELETQKALPFEVSVLPVPSEIAVGETAEIRLAIQRKDDYKDTQYFIRYFQFEGYGRLRYFNNPYYLPNDVYPLQQEEFRFYYTSLSNIKQSFEVWITDNHGNEKQLSFRFTSSD